MMNIVLSPELNTQLKKLAKKDKSLSEKVHKQLGVFSQDPAHPSLRIHKLSGALKNFWSISITRKHRMTYLVEEDTAIFTQLGTHDEVYRK